MEEIYLLTNCEFIILAAAAGIHRLYGFDMASAGLERENAVYVLQDLTRKGYLEVKEERFQLTGVMPELFEQIRHAETFLEVHKKSGRKCMLYIGERVIKVSQSMCRDDTYEVSEILCQETWKTLQEEGWIPGWTEERAGKKDDIG